MAEPKTKITSADVRAFIDGVDHPTRRADARTLDSLFRQVTGWTPRMWGPSMIGYGQYHYAYASGHSGDSLATGFAPRAARLSIYIMPGYADFSSILARLGKHKIGKSCLYINKLADVDLDVLAELIEAGLTNLRSSYVVTPT